MLKKLLAFMFDIEYTTAREEFCVAGCCNKGSGNHQEIIDN